MYEKDVHTYLECDSRMNGEVADDPCDKKKHHCMKNQPVNSFISSTFCEGLKQEYAVSPPRHSVTALKSPTICIFGQFITGLDEVVEIPDYWTRSIQLCMSSKAINLVKDIWIVSVPKQSNSCTLQMVPTNNRFCDSYLSL